jgi:hypothetical protein
MITDTNVGTEIKGPKKEFMVFLITSKQIPG